MHPHPIRALARRSLIIALAGLSLAACGREATQPAAGGPTAAPIAATAPATAAPPAPTLAPTSAPTPAGPQRISFAPGATSAAVEGAAIRGERAFYVLGAAAGQRMDVSLSSLEQNGAIVITGPDGRPLPGAEPGADAAAWSGLLPAAGDYTIEVGPTRGNVTYRLEVRIVTPQVPAGAIRSADWASVLAADPALDVRQESGELYVSVRGAEVGGSPLLDDIVYGDFEGDGREDAAILLNSGGTAGNIGLLVYRDTGAGPGLAAWRNGYKLWAAAEGGLLTLREPIYASWEPNCCPSGFATGRYALRAGRLEAVESRTEGVPEARPEVVRAFYDLIRRGELAQAYALLSDAEQAAAPFERWAAGYADTVDLAVTAEPDPAGPELVRIDLTATDRTADGGQRVQRFAGTWQVRWDEARAGWSLGSPQIVAQP